MDEIHEYRTEDGKLVKTGDRVYNYYDMVPGTIGKDSASDGWFKFLPDGGGVTILNGQRICSMEYARMRGFRDSE